MVKNYLNTLKNKGNFTCAEVANLSGVPEPTIRKILSGETADPRFDTVVKLVSAMGGSVCEITEEKKTEIKIEANAIITLKETYEARIQDIKEHNSSLKRDKRILAIVVGVLVLVLVALLVFDVSIGSHGWVRY